MRRRDRLNILQKIFFLALFVLGGGDDVCEKLGFCGSKLRLAMRYTAAAAHSQKKANIPSIPTKICLVLIVSSNIDYLFKTFFHRLINI